MFDGPWNVFEKLSWKEDGFGPKSKAGELADAFGTVDEKEQMDAEV